ncbi:MAG TPA: hypothetical protein VHT26_07675 [Trebonia sp.]|jgi:hypothetical protein|nr:hypothetical protein [Trebonia sp.]
MAYEIRDFTVTVPAGTSIASGFTSPLTMPARIVTQINVRIPPGPRGEVGFKIGTGGLQILPAAGGTWIVTDDEDLIYPLTDTIDSGAWQLLAYNTGSFDHTLRIYFFCDLLVTASSAASGGGGVAGSSGSAGDGSGTGDGTGGGTPTPTPTPVPVPVPVPPVVPPVTIPNPVLLPPVINIPPSLGGPVLPADPEEVMIGVAELSEVWLLTEDAYRQVTSQDDVNTLVNMGIQPVAVSSGLHSALLEASTPDTTVAIGPDVLAGWWQAVVRGGVPPNRA